MNIVLKNAKAFTRVYIDVVFFVNVEGACEYLSIVLNSGKLANYQCIKKCKFWMSSSEFWGDIVGNGHASPSQANLHAIVDYLTLQQNMKLEFSYGSYLLYKFYPYLVQDTFYLTEQ